VTSPAAGAARLRRLAARAWLAVVATLATAPAGSPAAAEPVPHAAYVARALAAVRSLGTAGCAQLDREIYTAARTRCHADTATPTASCLIDAARAACAPAPDRARCEAAADIIATNLRDAATMVDDATRIRLVRSSTDYHAALAGELHRRYAVLAAELVLGGASGDEAHAIDELCLGRDRTLHACEPGDKACVPSLPWSRCVAALVWFVGGGP
jgi:hypothetical protein